VIELAVGWELLEEPRRTVYHLAARPSRMLCGSVREPNRIDVFGGTRTSEIQSVIDRALSFGASGGPRSTCDECLQLAEDMKDPITKLGDLVR